MNKITIAVRTQNQKSQVSFFLENIQRRYINDIDEVLILDNLSEDDTKSIVEKYSFTRYISIKNFSYGRSANLIAQEAKNDIIVIFSAHSYPVSWDFFKIIKLRFENNSNLAGVRCLNYDGDYKNYINKSANRSIIINTKKEDYNIGGLVFAGSAFNKKVWKKINFDDNIITFEDKDWSKKVLQAGFDIEIAPVIFCYNIKRTKAQLFFRYKNELLGSINTHGYKLTFKNLVKGIFGPFKIIFKNFIEDNYFQLKKSVFLIKVYCFKK